MFVGSGHLFNIFMFIKGFNESNYFSPVLFCTYYIAMCIGQISSEVLGLPSEDACEPLPPSSLCSVSLGDWPNNLCTTWILLLMESRCLFHPM